MILLPIVSAVWFVAGFSTLVVLAAAKASGDSSRHDGICEMCDGHGCSWCDGEGFVR